MLTKVPDFDVEINGKLFPKVSNYTYLDDKMTFYKHVQKLIKKVSCFIYQFRRMRRYLNDNAALLVYTNMTIPISEYGDIFLESVSLDVKKSCSFYKTMVKVCIGF